MYEDQIVYNNPLKPNFCNSFQEIPVRTSVPTSFSVLIFAVQLTNLEKLICMSVTEIERRANISSNDASVLLKAVADLLISQPIISGKRIV